MLVKSTNGNVIDMRVSLTKEMLAEMEANPLFPHPSAPFKRIPNPLNIPLWTNGSGLQVIASVEEQDDGKEWLHVSFSRRDRMPDYKDMTLVKRFFIGDDKKAIMVLPDKAHHVNIYEYCLHLMYCPNDGLPEFSHGGQI